MPRHLIAFENLLSLVCQTYYRQASEFEMLTAPVSETDRRTQTYNNLIMIQKTGNPPTRKRGRPCRTKVFVATKSSKAPTADSTSNSVSPTHMLDYLASPLKSDMEYGNFNRKLDVEGNCHLRNWNLSLRKKIRDDRFLRWISSCRRKNSKILSDSIICGNLLHITGFIKPTREDFKRMQFPCSSNK